MEQDGFITKTSLGEGPETQRAEETQIVAM